MPHIITTADLDLIKGFEGCRLTAYQDSVGIWTIGYGHTAPEVLHSGLTWTQAQADAALATDLQAALDQAQHAVTVPLTDMQWRAVLSFVFNFGAAAFRGSTLLQLINQSKFLEAAKQFPLWDHAGPENKGLLVRRFREAILFLGG